MFALKVFHSANVYIVSSEAVGVPYTPHKEGIL